MPSLSSRAFLLAVSSSHAILFCHLAPPFFSPTSLNMDLGWNSPAWVSDMVVQCGNVFVLGQVAGSFLERRLVWTWHSARQSMYFFLLHLRVMKYQATSILPILSYPLRRCGRPGRGASLLPAIGMQNASGTHTALMRSAAAWRRGR